MPFLNSKLGIDFSAYIADRTTNFTGREWVFEAIQNWLADPKGERFFLLTGEPGSGKTAIAARLTQFAQGVVSPPKFDAGFLHAVHFCSARDSVWTDPKEFVRSIALQLAQSIPEFGLALKDIGEKTNNINVDISVGTAQNSTIQGVVVQNLTISGLTGQEAFTQVVVNPLRQIREEWFNQPVTILVDSLDEALTHDGESTIVDLLSKLSSGVKIRLILTSRNEARVKDKLVAYEELFLSAAEHLAQNQKDVREYIDQRFSKDETLQNHLKAESLGKEALTTTLIDKSEGNFLYVRFLLDSVASEQQSLTNLEGLPQGLDELYYGSLGRVVKLGKKDWSEVYAPVMGVLLAAQESLTESQIRAFTKLKESVVWDCLNDLQQFLDEIESEDDEARYKLYHRSVTDFLGKRQLLICKKKHKNRYYLPAQEQHQRIIDYYEKTSRSWQQLWEIDRYGLKHLAYHLKLSGQEKQLYQLLTSSPSWMNAKFAAFFNDEAYVADLQLALFNFTNTLAPHELVIFTQLYAVRQVIYHRASRNTDADLKTLIWLGGEAEAIHFAHQRSDNVQRFRGLLTIHKTLQEKGQPLNAALVREMWESAQAIEIWTERTEALRELATVLGQIGHRAEANEIFTEAIESIKNKTKQAMEEAVTFTSQSIGLKEAHRQFDGLKELAFVLIQLGQFVEAKKVIQKLADSCHEDSRWGKRDLINLRSQLSIALAQAAQFDEAKTIARTINDRETQAITLKHLAINLAHARQFAQAEKIVQNIDSLVIKTETLKHLAVALIQAGQPDRARATFAEVWKIALLIEDSVERSKTFSELAIALLQADQKLDAMQAFANAKEIALSIENSGEQDEALRQLAIALASAKHFVEAEEVARTIKDYWRQAESLRHIGIMLIQAGQQSEALVTFTNAREINRVAETNDKRPEVLKQMALAFAQTGYLIEAEQTIQVIDNSENQALVLRDIAVILMQTGYQDKAMEFIEHAKEAAYICRSDTALRALVPVLVQLKDFVEAEQVAKAINFSASRMAALGEIVTALAKSGQLAEAERLVKSMETGGHQAIALRELASAKQHTEVEQKVQLIDSSKNLVPAIIAILSDFLDMENLKVLLYKKSRKTRWRCVVRLRSDCYSQIADALAPGDCQVQASKMLDEAEQLARLLGSSKGRVETLRKLKGTLIHLAQSGYVLEAERVACSIENEEQRSKALSHLATAMALTMNFKGAFNTVGLLDMNTFLSVLSEWTSAFEKLEPGLLAKILKEVVRIFGWVHPDWQKLSQLFDAKALHKNKA